MSWTTLISVAELSAAMQGAQPPLVLDCGFELAKPDQGRTDYLAGHIPGARYAHLDRDLSGRSDGTNGRHPLPDRDVLAGWLRAQGLHAGQQVVAYDASGGAFAARAWWLLRWLGHAEVAVLDGGRQAWVTIKHSLEGGEPAPALAGDFAAGMPLVAGTVDADEVQANIASAAARVLDARDPARFRGDPNPLDPVAGHIPGARNRFFRDNLDEAGQWRPADDLRADFLALLDGAPAILQCGSGVTACHNALAMEIAGLPGALLYPGSWSEWIFDPARPVARGAD
ncbi:sulfurtransferase [Novosphingobium colocasiae]|uniref:Sulfurtransferase n=1 Tax=Novosphingobium colocasiae TaxID=1256513 RepID=A0A918UDL0_9SPHN|nr:sulfurtransferase [Novosphingobium colocasiae]GGY93378.1 sulfurtransferase [Novosphingobium colocasiae]